MIVQRLLRIQHEYGYLPDELLCQLAREVPDVPLYRIQEVASFFPAFRREWDKPADLEVRVCRDMTCHHRGAAGLLAPDGLPKLAAELSAATGRTVHVDGISCLGRCDRAPALWIERYPPDGGHARVYAGRDPAGVCQVVRSLAEGKDVPADADAAYPPHTNPNWTIDPYARDPKLQPYSAVRKMVEFLAAARAKGPFNAPAGLQGRDLDKYVQENHPLLWELKVSTLAGMGGAGAPAYQKRLDVWQQAGPDKFVVANGDESEPGTFKDRELMLRFARLVVEGVIVSGLMVGAKAGYVYIRHEYHEQIEACRAEIERAAGVGACGPSLFGSGIDFPVEVFESPGGYICGEQTALLEAMEDRRGQPRNRPPDITSNGLRDRPTVLNNVETLAWVPAVVIRGGAEYAAGGWKAPPAPGYEGKPPRFSGRRVLSISGDVVRPGVYEVPIGLPLGELLTGPEYCGGLTGPLKAVATSGPSGGFLPATFPVPDFHTRFAAYLEKKKKDDPPADTSLAEWYVARHLPPGAAEFDLLTAPLDLGFFGLMRELFGLPINPLLGAGMVVYAGDTDVLDAAANFTRFFRNESCGKCVPCRIGSQKLVQIGTDLLAARASGGLPAADLTGAQKDINDLAAALNDTSICSLGTSAPTPLASALAYFPADATPRGR
jgi:NADH:ubiquinone oxidoreductase subunit F (NADH-binding)/NADH:ubiquinone oxidoreductase subunit E